MREGVDAGRPILVPSSVHFPSVYMMLLLLVGVKERLSEHQEENWVLMERAPDETTREGKNADPSSGTRRDHGSLSIFQIFN